MISHFLTPTDTMAKYFIALLALAAIYAAEGKLCVLRVSIRCI